MSIEQEFNRMTADDENPPPAKRKRYASTLPAASRLNLLNAATSKDSSHDLMEREMNKVQAELEGPNPSAIVKLLASTAAACHAAFWVHDAHCNRRIECLPDAHDRHRDRAHRRYVATLKALATVRRLESNQPTSVNLFNRGQQLVQVGGTEAEAVTGSDPKPIENV